MTEYEELIKDHGLTFAQQNELADAYDESPAGFARVAKRTLGAKVPAAALVAVVRKGEHVQAARLSVAPVPRFEPETIVLADPEVREHYVAEILAKLGRVGVMPAPSPIASAAALRANGEHFGYPTCCINQFVDDVAAGRSPGQLRGSIDGYVPCDECIEKKKQPTLAERLLAMTHPDANGAC